MTQGNRTEGHRIWWRRNTARWSQLERGAVLCRVAMRMLD
jgi:hypothetical protein